VNMPSISLQESSRWLKTNQWLNVRNRIDEICAYISSGNNLIDLANNAGFEYAVLMGWINKDNARRKMYEVALQDRKEWMVQTLLRELHGISTADVRKAFGDDGELLAMCDMPDEVARAIAGYDVDAEGSVRVKFVDRLRAMELLGKNLQMFVEKIEHMGKVTLEHIVAGSMGEARPMVSANPVIEGPTNVAEAAE